MDELIQKLEQRKAALIADAAKCEDVAALRSIMQQQVTVNEDLAALRSVQAKQETKKDDGQAERTKLVNDPNAVTIARSADFIQGKGFVSTGNSDVDEFVLKRMNGKGFIPAEERGIDKSLNTELEKREQAGEILRKKDGSATSPLSVFGELRTVTVTPASGSPATIIVPSSYSPTIQPDFPAVSSLVDAVSHLSLNGGDTFNQAYVTDIDTGGYTAEGQDAAQAETHFSYAQISRTKITAYAELTRELQKLPSAPYADVVFQNIRTSMRRLLAKEILVGEGGANQIVGIFSSKATAISADTDMELSQITDTTLDEIVFTFGGEEEVEDPAVLILSKEDLLAFSKVRTAVKQRFYDIQIKGNYGTINGVNFIINSACKPLMSTGTNAAAAGDYVMAYGPLSGYTLVEFAPMIVERSDDFKFRQGMTAFRGDCIFGGNVTRKNAFLRMKKASS